MTNFHAYTESQARQERYADYVESRGRFEPRVFESEEKTMSNHTPGNWEATDEVYHEDEIAVVAPCGAIVATVWPQGDDEEGKRIQRANLSLIAAATKLLEACKASAAELEQHIEVPGVADILLPLVLDAIALAEGAAP